MTMETERTKCALHERRLNEMESVMRELAETTKRIELVIARAMGALAVFVFVQPIVMGLVLHWLLKGR